VQLTVAAVVNVKSPKCSVQWRASTRWHTDTHGSKLKLTDSPHHRNAKDDDHEYSWSHVASTNIQNVPFRQKQSSPATRHGGAWGERRYSSYSFSTLALDCCEWSASRPGRALPPGKWPPVPIVQEAGWAPEPVWAQRIEENPLPLPGIEPRSSSLAARSQSELLRLLCSIQDVTLTSTHTPQLMHCLK
jgi:hypothetical protein